MHQQLCSRLGIQYPIIQAPMAGVSTPALAAAVCNAGGLGSLGVGGNTPRQVRALLAETRRLTAQPFNLNFFCHRPARVDAAREAAWLAHLAPFFEEFAVAPPTSLSDPYPSFVDNGEMLELLLDERPAVVSFHFGLPGAEAIRALRAAGIVLMASATNLAEARQIQEAGIDLLIAQGIEAGGHRGLFEPRQGDAGIGSMALTRLLVRQSTLPVICAGGIMDGAGIAAALDLGAGAAQLGTAFILCPESSANAAYRQCLQGPQAHETAITAAISGRPARGLVNRMHREVDVATAPPTVDYPIAYAAGKALHAAASAAGCEGFAAHWAGQGAPLARAMPAAELVRTLVDEWRAPQVS